MNYSAVILIVSCLAAITFANCPNNNCPPPTFPQTPCGVPDCSILSNRYRDDALFPHPDPNYYWQCAPLNATHWAALARPCACGTVFNPNTNPPRCTFWFSDNWSPICTWQNPPNVVECDPWCPDCNGDNVPGPQPPVTTPPPSDDGNNCECPCVPCVWWPCQPCADLNTCPCNNNNSNNWNRIG
ncbi:hypothetical protein PVAND_001263 [Polypedilum vanderplanki]|uniref:Chitin-binding type-2 domain-containing protein n=1 Tax=Polypedilum vanderplanki TaxID=319348 RepID=A0A9J6BMV0_POLVA|nr:hypothetical protein PVAND_001263 [Polypedilum vanderplanki]